MLSEETWKKVACFCGVYIEGEWERGLASGAELSPWATAPDPRALLEARYPNSSHSTRLDEIFGGKKEQRNAVPMGPSEL